MPHIVTPQDVIKEAISLRDGWMTRETAFQDWWKLLTLDETTLKQRDMEHFVSNDPRTFFNLSLHLLTPPFNVRFPIDGLNGGALTEASKLESWIMSQWHNQDKRNRNRGRGTFLHELVGYLLATGWYAVFVLATNDNCLAEVWNPATVYQEYSDEGLVRCVHSYRLTPTALRKKLESKGWHISNIGLNITTTLHDYWWFEGGHVFNAVAIGSEFAKSPTREPFQQIPILTGPTGGLPDFSPLIGVDDWQKFIGQSIVATNASTYKNYNKLMSFVQQLIRDTAQPRWFERSTGGDILEPERIFQRGAIFKGGPQDEIVPLPVNPIPVELTRNLIDVQNQIQRGSLPWALYGNIQQQIASYLMSQVAEAAQQILKPYRDTIASILSEVSNLWTGAGKKGTVGGFPSIPNLPESDLDVDFVVKIPGDLIQRATVARMLDPKFRLSTSTVMEHLFPEVKDTLREQSKTRAEDALSHELAITIAMIETYRNQAEELRKAGDHSAAELYEKAANAAEELLGRAKFPPTPTPPVAIGRGQAALPEEALPRLPEE